MSKHFKQLSSDILKINNVYDLDNNNTNLLKNLEKLNDIVELLNKFTQTYLIYDNVVGNYQITNESDSKLILSSQSFPIKDLESFFVVVNISLGNTPFLEIETATNQISYNGYTNGNNLLIPRNTDVVLYLGTHPSQIYPHFDNSIEFFDLSSMPFVSLQKVDDEENIMNVSLRCDNFNNSYSVKQFGFKQLEKYYKVFQTLHL